MTICRVETAGREFRTRSIESYRLNSAAGILKNTYADNLFLHGAERLQVCGWALTLMPNRLPCINGKDSTLLDRSAVPLPPASILSPYCREVDSVSGSVPI